MSVDPDTFFQGVQPPTASDPAAAEGQAPPVSPATASEPGQTEGTPPEEPDYRALSDKYRQEAEAERQRAAQHERKIQEFQQATAQVLQQQQAQQAAQRRQQKIDEAISRADTMRKEDAERYLRSEMQNIHGEYDQTIQQMQQQFQQREQMITRQLATPLYIEKLVKDNNLPAEAKERLMAFGDPDVAERALPMIKEHYEQKKEWEARLTQAARSQEAQTRATAGYNNLPGNAAPSTPAFEVPDNLSPEQKAFWIYDNVIQGR